MQDKFTPVEVILACLVLSSVGGLAALLRSGAQLTWRAILSAMLYSGMFGVVYGLISFNYFGGNEQNYFFLIGSSGLVGLGGTTLIDFVIQVVAKGGVNIVIKTKNPADDVEKGEIS